MWQIKKKKPLPKSKKQARILASIVRSLFLFFDLISVSAENSNSQNREGANEKMILIAPKLIAVYDLLIEILNFIQVFLGKS